jgi:hypothetical protein
MESAALDFGLSGIVVVMDCDAKIAVEVRFLAVMAGLMEDIMARGISMILRRMEAH